MELLIKPTENSGFIIWKYRFGFLFALSRDLRCSMVLLGEDLDSQHIISDVVLSINKENRIKIICIFGIAN